MNKEEKYLGIANHDIQMANNSQELQSYVASILCENDDKSEDIAQLHQEIKRYKEVIDKMKEKNLIDLGFYQDEPIGFKFDTSINKPVLCKRCDNYYYAYPTKTGWVYYRSRYLGGRDKEIIDISFDEWAYKVLKEVSK